MANAWRLGERNVAFNLDESEETLLLAAYAAVRDRIGHEPWATEFREMFLSQPKGPSARVIGAINRELRLSGQLTLSVRLRPSTKTDWMRWKDPEKVMARAAILDKVSSRSTGAATLAAARTAASRLAPPREWEAAEQEGLFAEAAQTIAGDPPPIREADSAHRPLAAAELLARVTALGRAKGASDDIPAGGLAAASTAPAAADRSTLPTARPVIAPDDAVVRENLTRRPGLGDAMLLLGRLEESQRAMEETQREQIRIQRAQLALLQEIADALRAEPPPYTDLHKESSGRASVSGAT